MGTNIDPCVVGSAAMISYKLTLADSLRVPASTHTLIPSPVTTHEVAIQTLPILKVAVWGVVNTRVKLGVCEDVVDNLPRVAVPELIFDRHPLRCRTILGTEPLVLGGVRFPWDVSQPDRINLCMEVLVISNRGEVAVRNKCCAPDIEKLIDNALREVGLKV